MAIVATDTRTSAQFEYKAAYDETGLLGLDDYSKTIGYVRESATNDQIYDGVNAFIAITIYRNAPYNVNRTDKSRLTVA